MNKEHDMTILPRLLLAVTVLAATALSAAAHGPTPQKVEEKITVAAKPDAVWAVLKNFDKLADWHPGIAKIEAEGGSAAGATRTLTLKNGGVLVEGLDEYNDGEKFYTYRLSKENVEALPVSFYSATITVKPAGDGSEVQWIGRFYRGDTSNFPPDNLNDEAAVKAMTEFLQQGLAGLKAKVETK
jgi:mxaD protein